MGYVVITQRVKHLKKTDLKYSMMQGFPPEYPMLTVEHPSLEAVVKNHPDAVPEVDVLTHEEWKGYDKCKTITHDFLSIPAPKPWWKIWGK